MQARFQEFTDNAVSKTVNMPYRAKKYDVARAFLFAYEKRLQRDYYLPIRNGQEGNVGEVQ
jgi:ribonucleotide reductase alpha subunit